MKKSLLLICLFGWTLSMAQQQEFTAEAILKEMEMIRKGEQAAAGRLLANAPSANGFTVATNNFDDYYLRLEWYLNPAVRYINGTVTHYFKMLSSGNSITLDLISTMTVDSVKYHGSKITFSQTPEHGVVLNFPATIAAAAKDSVSIYYQGDPANTGLGSFYQGLHAGIPVIWTLSEPYGAREWWPCKNSLTDKIDSIDVILSCPQQYQGTSNGIMVSNTVTGPTRTSVFKHRYPIATYLIATAVTNYQIYDETVTVGSDAIALQSFVYPESGTGFTGYKSFTDNCFKTYTKWFGDYPFKNEKYGHTQWGWNGGMEHQTNSFVIIPTPTLQAHELAHQWFGDRITCGSWQDIWLNEGFATYLSLLFVEDGYPSFFKSTQRGIYNIALIDSAGSVFCTDTTDENRIFSSKLSYNKGAYVVQMLRWVMGDSAFARGVRRYLADPALSYGFAKTADLQRNLEAEHGKSLDYFFQQWVYGEGYPNYSASWSQNKNNFITLNLIQSTTAKSTPFFRMPVPLLLKNGSQSKTVVVQHDFSGQSFTLNPGFAVDSIFIDPDLWLLSKIKVVTKTSGSTKENELTIYPNPTKGDLQLVLNNPTDSELRLELWNTLGQQLYTRTINLTGVNEKISIPATNLAAGIYYLRVKSDKKGVDLLKKIVKQ